MRDLSVVTPRELTVEAKVAETLESIGRRVGRQTLIIAQDISMIVHTLESTNVPDRVSISFLCFVCIPDMHLTALTCCVGWIHFQ